jgi:hypothetical protein
MDNPLSYAEQELLRTAKARIAERRRAGEEERQRTLAFTARTQRVAAVYHEKLLDQIARSTGVDIGKLMERHQAERNSAMDFLATEKRRALDAAPETKRFQQIEVLERAARLRRIESQSATSLNFVGVQLTSATEIDLNANVGTFSIAPQENLVHTKVEVLGWVSALQWDMRGDVASIDWHFLWTPPRDGVINALSALLMNGWGFAYPGPGCVKGSSFFKIGVQLSVTQVGAGGIPFTDSVGEFIASDSFTSSDVPTFGGVILQPKKLDYPTLLSYGNQFVAIGQTPLLVTMSVTMYALVAHGEAEINFIDGDFQLNVPAVFVGLT